MKTAKDKIFLKKKTITEPITENDVLARTHETCELTTDSVQRPLLCGKRTIEYHLHTYVGHLTGRLKFRPIIDSEENLRLQLLVRVFKGEKMLAREFYVKRHKGLLRANCDCVMDFPIATKGIIGKTHLIEGYRITVELSCQSTLNNKIYFKSFNIV
jgi:hypothetical protein